MRSLRKASKLMGKRGGWEDSRACRWGVDSVEAGWYNSCTQTYDPSTRCALMRVAPARDWNVFQQIFAEHWDGFKHAHPRYQTSYYDGLVAKMLRCGDPDQMGVRRDS